jgi:hypothetical protein
MTHTARAPRPIPAPRRFTAGCSVRVTGAEIKLYIRAACECRLPPGQAGTRTDGQSTCNTSAMPASPKIIGKVVNSGEIPSIVVGKAPRVHSGWVKKCWQGAATPKRGRNRTEAA